MRSSWQTNLPGAGYKVFIYASGTRHAAKIYLSADSTDAIDSMPQIVTDDTGVVRFWVDTNDYDLDQRFDIEIYDNLGRPYIQVKSVNIFRLNEYLLLRGASVYSYTWNNHVRVGSGECLSIVLPPNREITIPDGYDLTIEDGGDLVILGL